MYRSRFGPKVGLTRGNWRELIRKTGRFMSESRTFSGREWAVAGRKAPITRFSSGAFPKQKIGDVQAKSACFSFNLELQHLFMGSEALRK